MVGHWTIINQGIYTNIRLTHMTVQLSEIQSETPSDNSQSNYIAMQSTLSLRRHQSPEEPEQAPQFHLPYLSSKVYVIRSPNTHLCFVGSTTLPLQERFDEHQDHLDSVRIITRSELVTDHGKATISLIEAFPCSSDEELQERMEYHRDRTPNTVNRICGCLSNDQRRRLRLLQPNQEGEPFIDE